MIAAALVLLLSPIVALALGFFLFHRRWPGATHAPILVSCAVVTAAAWALAAGLLAGRPGVDVALWRWIGAGGLSVDFGLRVDGLGVSVLAMVTLVGALIHAYAVGYMRGDPGFSRFFLYFHLFFFSMIGLLLSNNYLQLYLFWEGVGLASYLLIGFWRERESARRAALKAFLVNRVGDACFLFAIFLLARSAGTLRFTELFARLDAVGHRELAWIAGLLFLGACAKSAQFPLYVWLPDAMEGPTPTSALMHAATMVTAGVFLMARSWPILERVPAVLAWIAATGAFTSLLAAAIAFTRKDLKRILAYSTVSHLGLMMLALGCGDVYAATAHLVMHGFFKATLFLCAGNIAHHVGKSTAGVDETGGLARELPLTWWCFALAALSLAGIPPLSGFFSKDLVIEAAAGRGPWLGICAVLIAGGSGLYIGRMGWLAFWGRRPEQKPPRGSHAAHEHWLAWPVASLAFLSAAAGLVLAPTGALYRLFLASPLWSGSPFPEPRLELGLGAVGLAAAALGLGASWVLALGKPSWDWEWRRAHPMLEALFDADLGWQAVVGLVARSAAALARFTAWTLDQGAWDRLLQAAADSFVGLSEGLSGLSRGLLNEYLWWMAVGASLFILGLTWAH